MRITLIVDPGSATLTLVTDDLVHSVGRDATTAWPPSELNWSIRISIPTRNFRGDAERIRMTLNSALLRDCLEGVGAAEVALGFAGVNGPVDVAGDDHRTLVMPIKVEGYARRDETIPWC